MKDNWDIYLASPYSHNDPQVRAFRFHQVCRVAGWLLEKGLYVYSPIAHTHPIAEAWGLPKGFEFWRGFDQVAVEFCECLAVLTIEGWRSSVGVRYELELATSMGKEVFFVKPGHSLDDFIVNPNLPEPLLELGAQRLAAKHQLDQPHVDISHHLKEGDKS